MARRLNLAIGLVIIGLGAATLPGCGSKSSYTVSGRAQYQDGSPITGGVRIIRLEPTDDSPATVRRTASANIAEDGRFEMFMRKPGDGVVPGKYVVTFTVLDKPMGGTSLILPKYTKGVESPYVLEVDGDKTGLLYELEKL